MELLTSKQCSLLLRFMHKEEVESLTKQGAVFFRVFGCVIFTKEHLFLFSTTADHCFQFQSTHENDQSLQRLHKVTEADSEILPVLYTPLPHALGVVSL